MSNYSQWYVNATYDIACKAHDRMMQNGGAERLWLYYKPQGLAFAIASEAEDKPEGFELVTGEAIPSNVTRDRLCFWVRRMTGSVPVLPSD